MKNYILLIIALTLLGCKQDTVQTKQNAQSTPQEPNNTKELLPEVDAITKAHGIENWNAVASISFTFNVDRNGKNVAQRSWIWSPKSDDVTMMTATDTVSYNRKNITKELVPTDQGFINDKFWLLAPFQIAWDEGTTITVQNDAQAPLSSKPMKKVTLTYGNEGGYTPGDAYDFYYKNPDQIEEWVFRKGNANEPTMITTFSDYMTSEGVRIATDHRDKDGNFYLYFTNVDLMTKK